MARARNIPEHLERIVAERGEAAAICSDGSTLSYAAWNRKANRLARAILARSPEMDRPIGLVFGFGVSGIIAMFAALKTGKPYSVFDPAFESCRLGETAAHFGPDLLVTDAECAPTARQLALATGASILDLNEVDPALPDDDLALPLDPERVSYVYYTSGSTGRPKGVIATHTIRLVNYQEFASAFPLRSSDRFTNLHSLGFSAAASEIWGALMTGATLYPIDVRKVGFRELAERLVRHRITLWGWTASAFRRFVSELPEGAVFPELRGVLLGSEPVTRHEVELFRRPHFSPDCVLVNRYGATEIANTHYYFFRKQMPDPVGTLPVGFVVGPRTVRLEDAMGQPVAPGDVGEIVVESALMTPGYWKEPELTAARFERLPSGDRVYRTGDLGRLLEDGSLQHLGRKDGQVKVRGYRVELVEVEGALLGISGVADAAVVADRAQSGDVRLVAYVVPAVGSFLTAEELRRRAAELLPGYMVPALFQFLPALPLTDTGKIARAALPAPDGSAPEAALPDEALPPLEARLLEQFRAALGRDGVGPEGDFFELGGDSLQAAQFINRLSAAGNDWLPPTLLFEAPTVREIADLLRIRFPEVAEKLSG